MVQLVQSSWPCASLMQGYRSPPAAGPAPHAGDDPLLASAWRERSPFPGRPGAAPPGQRGQVRWAWLCVRRGMTPSALSRPEALVQFSSVAQSCPTLCDPMDCSTPGLPVHHQLPELAQTHVHRVSDTIQPSHPLSSPSSPTFNLFQHQGLFK